MLDLFSGLDYAHKRGIFYRGIKPANLLIEKSTGRLKLADVGVARMEGNVDGSRDFARFGGIAGRIGFASRGTAANARMRAESNRR